MPQLPANLVSAPFDSPLRRTEPVAPVAAIPSVMTLAAVPPAAADVRVEAAGTPGVPPTSPGRRRARAAAAPTIDTSARSGEQLTDDPMQAAQLTHRISVRISEKARLALHEECYRRRISSEKVSVAEIASEILDRWAEAR